jgi:hypothetical protein
MMEEEYEFKLQKKGFPEVRADEKLVCVMKIWSDGEEDWRIEHPIVSEDEAFEILEQLVEEWKVRKASKEVN